MKLKTALKKVGIVILGASVIGVSINLFYVPVNLLGGGVTSIMILLNILFGFDMALFNLLINIPILILGYFIVDREFMLLSTLGMFCMTAAIYLSENIPVPSHDLFTCIVAGGVSVGIGAGILLRQNSSCGGVDTLCRALYKHFSIPMGNAGLAINGVILLFSCYFLGLEAVVAAIVLIFIIGRVINFIVEGTNYKRTVIIISKEADQIAAALMEEFRRGITITEVTGAYSGVQMKQIMCAINPHQTPKLRNLVLEIDSQAFVTINESISVIGGGFKASDLD